MKRKIKRLWPLFVVGTLAVAAIPTTIALTLTRLPRGYNKKVEDLEHYTPEVTPLPETKKFESREEASKTYFDGGTDNPDAKKTVADDVTQYVSGMAKTFTNFIEWEKTPEGQKFEELIKKILEGLNLQWVGNLQSSELDINEFFMGGTQPAPAGFTKSQFISRISGTVTMIAHSDYIERPSLNKIGNFEFVLTYKLNNVPYYLAPAAKGASHFICYDCNDVKLDNSWSIERNAQYKFKTLDGALVDGGSGDAIYNASLIQDATIFETFETESEKLWWDSAFLNKTEIK